MLNVRLCVPFSRVILAKTWRLWAIALVGLIAGMPISSYSPKGASITGCLLLVPIILLLGALALVDGQDQASSSFPGYLQQLPIGDAELVLWPMLISAFFLGTLGFGIAVCIFGSNGGIAESWWLTPYLAANGCLFQTSSWVPLKRPELRVTLSLVVMISIVFGPIAYGFGLVRPVFASLIYTGLMVASMALSVRGVSRSRHGIAVVGSADRPSYKIPFLPSFSNRIASQVWLEGKRNGMVMRVLTTMFLVLFAFFAFLAVPWEPSSINFRGGQLAIPAIALASMCLLVPPFLAYGGCCGSEHDNLAKDRSIVPFLALRPLTELQIVEAKIRSTIQVVLRLSWAPVVVAIGILLLPIKVDGQYHTTLLGLSHVLTLRETLILVGLYCVMVLMGMKSAVSGIWCTLGRLPTWGSVLISIVPLAPVTAVGIRLVFHPDEIPRFLAYLPDVIWIWATVKLVVLVPSISRLREMRLASDSLIVKWFAGCAIAGVAFFLIVCSVIPAAAYSRWAIATQIFCMLPLVRIVLAPIFVYRGRHG